MKKDKKIEKFEYLAEKRVTEIIKRLQILGNLSNKSNYSYTQNHINQIFRAIDKEVKNLKNKFTQEGELEDVSFKFE